MGDDADRLTSRERGVLDALLRLQFPGVAELRAQARSVLVVARLEPSRSRHQRTMVRFRVADPAAPRARVRLSQPVFARVRDRQPRREVLLTVRDGLLFALEVVDHGGELPEELPSRDELRPPSVNFVVELSP